MGGVDWLLLLIVAVFAVGAALGWLSGRKRSTARGLALVIGLLLVPAIAAVLIPRGTYSSCVLEGTLVATPGGTTPIEALRAGDLVLGRGASGEDRVGTVVATRRAERNAHIQIVLASGETLGVTAEHPVAAAGAWIRAGQLVVGDCVDTQRDRLRIVRIERRSGPVRVCDLQVDGCANFFANGVLVHNKSFAPRPPEDDPADKALIGDWEGWDTVRGTIFCRLELREGGTGRCALFRETSGNAEVSLLSVRGWGRVEDEIRIELVRDGAQRPFLMKGRVTMGMLMLQYGGEDGPEHFAPWLGVLQLVEEEHGGRVSAAVRSALNRAPPDAGR